MNDFYQQVYDLIRKIPYGKVISYGQIAWMLGRPHGARQVGYSMRFCPDGLPYHRVVRADGSIVGGIHAQSRRALLESEDVAFLPDGRVDLQLHRWVPGQ